MPPDTTQRRLPTPTPETQDFWDGTLVGEIRLQRCSACDHTYFPPRPFCPSCTSRHVQVFAASGRGTLYGYVINQRSRPGYEAPFSIAVFELDEGPRRMTHIVGCDQTPAALQGDRGGEVTLEGWSDEGGMAFETPLGGGQ